MNTHSEGTLAFARALADPTRGEIMRLCCCEWRSVRDLVTALEVTQPTVSHHLAVLREAGLVRSRKAGRQVFYTLNQERVAYCCGQLMLTYAPDVAPAQEV
jgi:DNA-binding transcriptional ArsR family regulator